MALPASPKTTTAWLAVSDDIAPSQPRFQAERIRHDTNMDGHPTQPVSTGTPRPFIPQTFTVRAIYRVGRLATHCGAGGVRGPPPILRQAPQCATDCCVPSSITRAGSKPDLDGPPTRTPFSPYLKLHGRSILASRLPDLPNQSWRLTWMSFDCYDLFLSNCSARVRPTESWLVGCEFSFGEDFKLCALLRGSDLWHSSGIGDGRCRGTPVCLPELSPGCEPV